jgi:hypothetical protein
MGAVLAERTMFGMIILKRSLKEQNDRMYITVTMSRVGSSGDVLQAW